MRIGVLIMSFFAISKLFAIDANKYNNLKPNLVIEDFFNGKIKAWGIIQDRSGDVLSKFDVDMVGSWEGDKGKLVEDFRYYDTGKTQHRVWEITKLSNGRYTGTAADIIGIAEGTAHGNAINWHYEMDVPVKNTSYRMKFDDWMWAMHDGVVVNRSYLKKFGITFAEITIFMEKQK